jgi:hypothetical protein
MKIGVDIVRPVIMDSIVNDNVRFFQMDSLAFLTRHEDLLSDVDMAFIDGLHEYHQVYVECMRLIRSISVGGIIFIHDCNPTSARMARPFDTMTSEEYLHHEGAWTGDVWKAIVLMRCMYPQWDIRVMRTETGMGILRKPKDVTILPVPGALWSAMDKLTYDDLAKDRENLINLCEVKTDGLPGSSAAPRIIKKKIKIKKRKTRSQLPLIIRRHKRSVKPAKIQKIRSYRTRAWDSRVAAIRVKSARVESARAENMRAESVRIEAAQIESSTVEKARAVNRMPETKAISPVMAGKAETHVEALAYCEPLGGQNRWMLRLLEDMSIELKIIGPVTDLSMTRAARKIGLKPRLKDRWAIPSECDAAFVAGIEDILAVYARPLDPDYPVVCMDEKLFRPMNVTRRPLRRGRLRGQCARRSAIFAFIEPLTGWHRTSVLEHRCRDDWAKQVCKLLEEDYPHARKVCLVMNTLNTHNIAALYRAFPAEKAFQLANRLEIHYAPKFGGWLNVAEIEMSIMERHCLGKYIPDAKALARELSPWSTSGNETEKAVRWQFTNDQARRRLKHLYPEIND